MHVSARVVFTIFLSIIVSMDIFMATVVWIILNPILNDAKIIQS